MTVNVTCAADQYLENNVCVTKVEQTITPLKIKYILTDSVYSLDTESSAKLPSRLAAFLHQPVRIVRANSRGLGRVYVLLNSPKRVIPKHW